MHKRTIHIVLIFFTAALAAMVISGQAAADTNHQGKPERILLTHAGERHGGEESKEQTETDAPEKAASESSVETAEGEVKEDTEEHKGEKAGEGAEDSGPEEKGISIVEFFGQFHVVFVHFPIALILGALLAEALSIIFKSELMGKIALFNIVVGALGATVAAPLGWLAAASEVWSGNYAAYIEYHRWLGTSTAALAVAAAILGIASLKKDGAALRWASRIFTLAASVTVGLTGYFGGQIVHGIGHYRWF